MTQTRKLSKNNTTVTTDHGITTVKLHSTIVVAISRGAVTLNSGGWQTATTKVRMNQASNEFDLRFHVFQKNHDWFVRLPSGKVVDFVDCMMFPIRRERN